MITQKTLIINQDIGEIIQEVRMRLSQHFDPRVKPQFEIYLQEQLEEYFRDQKREFQRENRNTTWQQQGLQLEMDVPVTIQLFGKFQEIYNPKAFIHLLNQLIQMLKIAAPQSSSTGKGQKYSYINLQLNDKNDVNKVTDKDIVLQFLDRHVKYISLAEESQQYLINLYETVFKGSEVVEHRPDYIE